MAKIIIRRMTDAVDAVLRKEQTGFKKHRCCTDQIFALLNIKLYVNSVDFKKAIDSVHPDSLWNIQSHYDIPSELVHLIKSFNNNLRCSVGHNYIFFNVKTGVREGCVMSALQFKLVINWVMRETT